MRIPPILRKVKIDPRKAVAPDKGAAAFSCSTGKKHFSRKAKFPTVSRLQSIISRVCCDFLPKMTYFRRCLAKGSAANVVLTEGQKAPSENAWR